MANISILNAFNRFWQHVVALVGKKADKDEVVDLTSEQTITGAKTFSNGVNVGDASITYDKTNKRLVISFD